MRASEERECVQKRERLISLRNKIRKREKALHKGLE